MELGITFSHRHLKNLGVDVRFALEELNKLGVKWMRVCCYWDEIESTEGEFNFKETEEIIKFCELNKISVILTVGMKSPRFPEYYIAKWLEKKYKPKFAHKFVLKDKYLLDKTNNFIKKCVMHFKRNRSIKVWQVENEPLDRSGEKWQSISSDFLSKEVDLVRKLDNSRKIMINLWGNELGIRKLYKKAIVLADVVGLDIYLRHPIPFLKIFNKFIGPMDSKKQMNLIAEEIKNSGKQLFIAELQAEPWEPDEIVTTKFNPKSFLPKHLVENIEYTKSLSPEIVLLWGFEYWLWRKNKGDDRYWNEALKVFKI